MSEQSKQRSGRATRLLLGAALGLLLTGGVASDLSAQRVVMVHQEPRHRLVWEEGDLKLLDVQIQPGDTTMSHTHASPIMYTYINLGRGPTGGRINSNTDYATEPYTHAVSNDGDQLFRIIALAHYGPAVNGTDRPPTGLAGEPELENPWFRSYRVELAPGEETPMIQHSNPAIVVQVTDGHADVSKSTGYGADLMEMGDWTARAPNAPYRIRNAGTEPVTVVVNEGRVGR